MEQTLKVTNALSDPTRFNIYQYIVQNHKVVTVNEIAEVFDIHPNVARMHLSKLEDIHLIISFTKKTGKGGRPSRLYKLSDDVIELSFPYRDYKLLASISLETLALLGDQGKKALYETGRKYGEKVIERYQTSTTEEMSVDKKLQILHDAGTVLGMYPEFTYNQENNSITYTVHNCPFKEVALNHEMVCDMHEYFLKGIFESLFTNIDFFETNNIFKGCENCTYVAKITAV